MEQLITIKKSDGGKDVVSARDLYNFLSIDDGSNFTKWAKVNIEEMFIQNVDYQILRVTYENGGRPGIDYAIILDTAKQISMMSRCEKGKKARLYFIECEKALKSQLPDFNNPAIAARAWADEFEKRTLAESKVKELAPKAVVYDNIANADNLTPLADIAKTLGYGRNTLMNEMRERKILRKNNTPYQEYIGRGYFVVKVNPIIKGGKEITNYTQTFVTGKGIVWLSKEFEK